MHTNVRTALTITGFVCFTALGTLACSGNLNNQVGTAPSPIAAPAPTASSDPFGWQSSAANSAVVCHRTGNGAVSPLSINPNALAGHLAHGDGQPGGAVPGMVGFVYNDSCVPQPAQDLLTCPCWNTFSEQSLVAHLQQFEIFACGGDPFGSAILTSGDSLVVRNLVGTSFCGGPAGVVVGELTPAQFNACSTELLNVAVALECAQ